MNIAIVTGASSGIGQEFAFQIQERYCGLDEIWVIARRKERLKELEESLDIPVRIFALDLSKLESIEAIYQSLKEIKPKVCVLVNASGFGLIANVGYFSYEREAEMIDVNIRSLTALTNICLPYLSDKAKIYMIASVASFMPQPGFAVYSATKSYVLSYARALREELFSKGITVIAVCPGPVHTEFFDIAEEFYSISTYKKLFFSKSSQIVKRAMYDAQKRKSVSTYGYSMKGYRVLAKLLPHSLLISIVSKVRKV